MRKNIRLHEGAIDISSVVLESEEKLHNLYKKIIEDTARTYIRVGEKVNDEPYTKYKVALECYMTDRQTGRSAAYQCMYNGSDLLTKIVQDYMSREYNTDDGVLIDKYYYPVENIRVVIEKNNPPEGIGGQMFRLETAVTFNAVNGGIPSSTKPFAGIKIYLHKPDVNVWLELIDEAVEDLIYKKFEGRSLNFDPGYYPDSLCHYIIPIFAHELDHLIYYTKVHGANEISIIASGGRKGNRWSHNEKNNKRYLSSHSELQAFASEAAISILRNHVLVVGKTWMTMHDETIDLNDTTVWNSLIYSLIRRISRGELFGSDMYTYRKDIKLASTHGTYQKAWNRFLNLLIKKLKSYIR